MNDEDDRTEQRREIFEHPPWKEAVRQFLIARFEPGDLVSFDWLYMAFRIRKPDPERDSGAVCNKLELQFLSQFKPFQMELLREHNIDLTNERGLGYRLVPPADQTPIAYDEGEEEVKKAMRRMVRRIAHVDVSALTTEQRKENADALARAAMMRGMLRQARKLNFLENQDQ